MGGGRIPGPLGIGSNREGLDKGTLASARVPGPIGMIPRSQNFDFSIDQNTRILAATAYGEGSGNNVFEEMAALANVLVRQQKARAYSSAGDFIRGDKTFAFAAHDGNPRYAKLMLASESQISADRGMAAAVRGARNALSANPTDYSNGAFFWDGADIMSNYGKHKKVLGGIHFGVPSHNIYKIESKDVEGEAWWKDAHGRDTKLRGKWHYKFESTAAYGGTIFWKYSDNFLRATGNTEFK